MSDKNNAKPIEKGLSVTKQDPMYRQARIKAISKAT